MGGLVYGFRVWRVLDRFLAMDRVSLFLLWKGNFYLFIYLLFNYLFGGVVLIYTVDLMLQLGLDGWMTQSSLDIRKISFLFILFYFIFLILNCCALIKRA